MSLTTLTTSTNIDLDEKLLNNLMKESDTLDMFLNNNETSNETNDILNREKDFQISNYYDCMQGDTVTENQNFENNSNQNMDFIYAIFYITKIADSMKLNNGNFDMHMNNDIIVNNNYKHLISSNKKQNANINDSPPTLYSSTSNYIIVINDMYKCIRWEQLKKDKRTQSFAFLLPKLPAPFIELLPISSVNSLEVVEQLLAIDNDNFNRNVEDLKTYLLLKTGNLQSLNSAVKSAFDVCFTREIASLFSLQGKTKKPFVKLGIHKVIHVTDQNSIPEIRNTIGTVREIIKFFRRKYFDEVFHYFVRHVGLKSISVFDENFVEIKTILEKLSISSEANAVTRNCAFQLSSATSNCTFLISLKVIAYYSSVLEPVVTKLQGTSVNLYSVHTFVKTELLGILHKHRVNSIEYFNTIFEEISNAANSLDFVLKIPRRTNHQTQRSNHNCSSNYSIEDYYSVSMYKPYLDSIISSLNNQLNENNETPFKLCWLLPNEMLADDFIVHNDVSEVIVEETSMIDKLNSINMPNSEPCFYINGVKMESSKVGIDNYCSITSSTCSLERALIEFDSIKVCRGIKSENVKASFGPQFVDFNGHWKHKNCFITVKNDKRLTIKIKKYRQNNDKKLKVHLTPSKREKFSNLMKSKKRINQKCSRVEKRLKVVQQNLDKTMVKGYVKQENTTFDIDDIRLLLNTGIERVTAENWQNFIKQVIEDEDKMWKADDIMDELID
ncbi:hypothetical protein ACI65C_006777 [Semiaphis heraclei]